MYEVVQFFYRILMVLMRKEVIGRERLDNSHNCLICANHISANDPPMIGSLIRGKISYLGKSELFKKKWLGDFLFKNHVIPVRRGRMDRKALRLVNERLENGESLMVFPEGTRKATTIKPGVGKFALEMQKDILPVFIENSDDIWGCFSGKKHLKFVVGQFIKIDQFKDLEHTKENYQYVADYVMERINELKNSN